MFLKPWVILLGFGVCLVSPASAAPRTITFETADGILIEGALWAPKTAARSGWVLLHGLSSVRQEWDPLAKVLAEQGQAVFLIDLRGHGGSVKSRNGKEIRFQQMTPEARSFAVQKMPEDLGKAVQLLARTLQIPVPRIAVGGASLGANVALFYAADHPDVSALVLLSAAYAYTGPVTKKAFQRYGARPLLMAASPQDGYAFETLQAEKSRRKTLKVLTGQGGAHGVQMFGPAFTPELVKWMGSPK